jgi:hypothetical protein
MRSAVRLRKPIVCFAIVGALLIVPVASQSATEDAPALAPQLTRQPRAAVPDQAAVTSAAKLVAEVFKTDLAKTEPAEIDAVAQKMFEEAMQTTGPVAGQYALLVQARDLAQKAGDLEFALRSVQVLGDRFTVDAAALSAQATDACLQSAGAAPPDIARRSADYALALCSRLASAGDFAQAARAASTAEAFAKASKDSPLASRFAPITPLARSVADAYKQAEGAIRQLASSPSDPAANLAAGRFYCLAMDNWQKGLPMLSRCADAGLRQLSIRELWPPGTSPEQAGLGDAWALLAKTAPEKEATLRRAAFWYRRALATTSDAGRPALLARLVELRASQLQSGLVCEMFTGRFFERRLLTRIDPLLNFDWQGNAPEPEVPPIFFGARWTGWIKVPTAGVYRINLHHDDGARLWIDGRLILDSWTSMQNDIVPVDLAAGLHDLRIDYQQEGGLSMAALLWSPPGSSDEPMTVPPEALFHEPSQFDQVIPTAIVPDANGTLHLRAAFGDCHGPEIHYQDNGIPLIGWWHSPDCWLSWDLHVPPGNYEVSILYSNNAGGPPGIYHLTIDQYDIRAEATKTGAWPTYRSAPLGTLKLSAGSQTLALRAETMHQDLMTVAEVTLTPVRK